MSSRNLMAAIVVACLGACSSSNGDASDSGTNPDASFSERCAPFAGKRFVSLEMLACGVGTTCFWHVTFSVDGTLYWQHSDVGEAATYVCNGNSVTGTSGGGATLTGQWDPKTARLSWQATSYKVESP